jgi:hypothetical protein
MERVGRALCRAAAGKYTSIVFALRFSRHSTGEFGHGAWIVHARCAPVGLRREGNASPPCRPGEEEVTLVVRIVMNERDHICAYRFDASPWTLRSLACGCDRVEVWAFPESLDEDLTNCKTYRFVLCCV